MVDYQWGLFWVCLDPVKGSEQAGKRPVLVISSEETNEMLPVVTVLPLTSWKKDRRIYSIEVLLKADKTGLDRNSIAMAHQIRVIDKQRIKEQCGVIKDEAVKEQIRNAIRRYLDI